MIPYLRIVTGMDHSWFSRIGGNVLVGLQRFRGGRTDFRHFGINSLAVCEYNVEEMDENHSNFQVLVLVYEVRHKCFPRFTVAPGREGGEACRAP